MKEFNLVLAGVGGQGVLLAAEILGTAAVKEGLNVRVGEIHGMAQRGGATVSTVRIGEKVFSPFVLNGQANFILGFEPLETLRNIKYASEKTLVIMGDEKIPPPELTLKNMDYPQMKEILKKIKRFSKNITLVETYGRRENPPAGAHSEKHGLPANERNLEKDKALFQKHYTC